MVSKNPVNWLIIPAHFKVLFWAKSSPCCSILFICVVRNLLFNYFLDVFDLLFCYAMVFVLLLFLYATIKTPSRKNVSNKNTVALDLLGDTYMGVTYPKSASIWAFDCILAASWRPALLGMTRKPNISVCLLGFCFAFFRFLNLFMAKAVLWFPIGGVANFSRCHCVNKRWSIRADTKIQKYSLQF